MLLALSLKVSKFITLFLNLFEQCLALLGSVLHPKKYRLIIEQVPDLPSIVSNARDYPMPVITVPCKPAKEKSPVREYPTGLCINL